MYPLSSVKRYSSEQKMITVSRPSMISKYNSHMGGKGSTSHGRKHIQMYNRNKEQKWWWPAFTWLVYVTVVNAWQLYKKSNENLTQLDFRKEITTNYLKSTFKVRRSISLNRVSDDVRYHRINHFVIEIPNKKRRRCAGEGCTSTTAVRTTCIKCDVGLCIHSFSLFHVQ